jgi:hypothetical protein
MLHILFYLETALHVSGGTTTHHQERKQLYLHRNNILIYIQQDAILHTLFYLETVLHVSGGTATHHQERKQLYLQYLIFVRPLLLPAAIAAGSSNGLTNTKCCAYSCLRS